MGNCDASMPKKEQRTFTAGETRLGLGWRVRIGKDIITFQVNNVDWVAARSGGVSTFSAQGPGRNWWLLPAGFDYPDELFVVNDHGNHFNWEPNVDTALADFVTLLRGRERGFRKIT